MMNLSKYSSDGRKNFSYFCLIMREKIAASFRIKTSGLNMRITFFKILVRIPNNLAALG
jgi:hypothetical protein